MSTHSPARIEASTFTSQAITAETVVLPLAQNSCLTLVCRPVYNLFSETLKVAIDDSKIYRHIAQLEKESLQIKPVLLSRWICCLQQHSYTEDPAVLS